MGRFKIKKQDTFIDMTPMSDVMVLLLTFFMLTATFVKEEPIKVQTPGSVSEIKIPETNKFTIFVNSSGKVYFTMDSPELLSRLMDQMIDDEKIPELTPAEKKAFANAPTFGMPFDLTRAWLQKDAGDRNSLLQKENAGIPCDSVTDELGVWVKTARETTGDGLKIAIKADQNTSYAVIKHVMASLRKVHENRYNLITALKGVED